MPNAPGSFRKTRKIPQVSTCPFIYFLTGIGSHSASKQNCLRLLVVVVASLWSAEREHVTRLALQRLTNPFQSIESNSLGLVFFQAPESRMTNAGFFGQPIEGPLMLFQ